MIPRRLDSTTEANLLRAMGIRVTPVRLRLFNVLKKTTFPLKIKDMKRHMKKVDVVTLYRNVEAFVRAGLVERLDFGEDVASYELRRQGEDHHHVTCTSCGKRTDVKVCTPQVLENARRAAKGFASVDRHALEFFGVCSACAKKRK